MSPTYKVIIIEDSELNLAQLKHSLKQYSTIEIVGIATSAEAGEVIVMEKQSDLLFLDIGLPGKSGLEFLHDIQKKLSWSMKTVMFTTYTSLMLESFREYAFDFLKKTYSPEEFSTVMNRFFECKADEENSKPLHVPEKKAKDSKFRIATSCGFKIIELEQIGYFEYTKERKQWAVVLPDKKRLLLKYQTTADAILAYSTSFFKINQNQIININYLAEIFENKCSLLPPFDDEQRLQVSRSALKLLQQEFSQL